MALDIHKTDGMSGPDAKVLNDIREFGWHVMGVSPRSGHEGDTFAYFIGLLHTYGHPEILVIGLPTRSCMNIVNAVGEEIKNGARYDTQETYGGILNDPLRVVFRRLAPRLYREYVGFAIWFYETLDFPVFQCVWPDKAGLLPW
jgi:hypothetical protein